MTRHGSRTAGAFGATVALLLAAGIHPHGRVWAFNHWAYWSPAAPGIFAAVGVLLFAAGWMAIRKLDSEKVLPAGSSARSMMGAAAAFALLFFAGRAQTHFLGDGYQSIVLLAEEPPRIRDTAPLLKLLLPQLRAFFGEATEATALMTYQFLSIVSGVLFVLAILLFASRFFSTRIERLLFTLSCATGGFVLLFFGYVENYAPFVAFTAITFLTGVSILEGKLSRVWLIPPALLMMSAHVFGILALPGVLFVLFSSEGVRRRLSTRRTIAWTAAIACTGAAVFLFFRWAQADPRIAVAILPVFPAWYTSEGYTLFSGKHLADLANLLFVLFPGCLVCAAFLLSSDARLSFRRSITTFFLTFAGAFWMGVFLLSPELGMPRDWDLFAFAGVPVVLFTSWWILRTGTREAQAALLGSIVLGAAVLVPRVAEARNARVAILHFRSYLTLDDAKGRNGYFHLIRHYRRTGQDELAEQEIDEWDQRYPERALMRTAGKLHVSGQTQEAIRMCREVLNLNPVNYEAWMILGEALLVVQDFEQARIASMRAYALSADRLRTTYNLGTAYASLGKFPEAEKWLRQSLELAPKSFRVNLNYALVCQKLGRVECFEQYLERAAQCEGADPRLIEEARKLPPPSDGKRRAGA
jgi:tetratricopeptide (TPR) repeat protein